MQLLFIDVRADLETDIKRSKSVTMGLLDAVFRIIFRGSASL